MRLTPNPLIARHNFEPPVRGALLELKGSTNSLRVRLTPLRVRQASLRVRLFTAKDYFWVGFGGRALKESAFKKRRIGYEGKRLRPVPSGVFCAEPLENGQKVRS